MKGSIIPSIIEDITMSSVYDPNAACDRRHLIEMNEYWVHRAIKTHNDRQCQ